MSSSVVITCEANEICGSHLKSKVANKCQNVCERLKVVENGHLPSPAVLQNVSVSERNPDRKKILQSLDSRKAYDIYGNEIKTKIGANSLISNLIGIFDWSVCEDVYPDKLKTILV